MNKEFIFINFFSYIFIITIFFVCYFFIIMEDVLKIKKVTSSMFASNIMWFIILLNINENNLILLNDYINIFLLDFFELFLFLFISMIFVNCIEDFGIFNIIKHKILEYNLSYKKIYWIIGFFSFFISPVIDNLTTAIFFGSIITSIEKKNIIFINLISINLVIAVNAGGVFSPFGDVTSLMIWQKNILPFKSFFYIFIPSFFSFFVPSFIISFKIPMGFPTIEVEKTLKIKRGYSFLILIFIITLVSTIFLKSYFKLSSIIGMMFGLCLLFLLELIYLKQENFFLKKQINKIDFETLFFFYSIMFCINALNVLGILNDFGNIIYNVDKENILKSHTYSNIIIGLFSSILDNIPITFTIIQINPMMSEGQWMLLTLTIGIGGSIFSIGSAPGIALMAQTKNKYNFFSHIKWSFVIFIGYIIAILMHLVINKNFF